jgi:hypothetical protein
MKCLPENKYLPWENAVKIMSTPLLVAKHGYKTDPVDCIEWILGEYRLKSECPKPADILVTDEPSNLTFDCIFKLQNPGSAQWVLDLAKHESILQPDEGKYVWVNIAPYYNIGDFKLANHEFPGAICGDDGYCYGEPLVKPLFARMIDLKSEAEKPVEKPSPISWVIPLGGRDWKGGRGFYKTKNSSWSYYYNSKRGLGLIRFMDPSGGARFRLGVYRPRLTLLHPYLLVQSRLDDGIKIASPLVSLESPDGRHITLASINPVEAVLRNGVLIVEPKTEDSLIIVSESPALSSLKQLYNTTSPILRVENHRVRGGNTQIASLRLGCGVLEEASFRDGWLSARIYNPGVEPCIGEVKLQGIVEEAYQDDMVIEPLYDRVRIALSKIYYGILRVKVRRSISLLLRLSGS